MTKVLHVITTTDTGGAETVLARLVTNMDPRRFENEIVSLKGVGEVGWSLHKAGFAVEDAAFDRNPARGMWHLVRHIRERGPDIVQTWLPHADLFGGLAARAAGIRRIAWNLRSSDLHPEAFRRTTRTVVRVCAQLSNRLPAQIVCGSEAAREFHRSLGYRAGRVVVIDNGFDVPGRLPDLERERLRESWGLPSNACVITRVARFHPHKDYATFVAAAATVLRSHINAHVLMCGEGVTAENATLREWIEATGFRERFHLLGQRSDVREIYGVSDIACSSSIGEGFPNVVGEAMAHGVPVVATDVGDSARIVGDTGHVVPPRDVDQLASALLSLVTDSADRLARGIRAVRRIERLFGLDRMVEAYERLYDTLIDDVRD